MPGRLRRELGVVESYAALIGILVGAGIFEVTGKVAKLTGPSAILGYLAFAPIILATSLPYALFGATSLGRRPGGEIAHIGAVLSPALGFVGAWLRIVSYVGALAYLANAFAKYAFKLLPVGDASWLLRNAVATGSLALFWLIHVCGVRWFGRIQVVLCAVLGLSLCVFVIPGLFHIDVENYQPFFGGEGRFFESLVPLFFAFAGFEALAQTAGEVRESRAHLPRVFLRGVAATTAIFLLMSIVAFGVLPATDLADAPIAEAAAVYLPDGFAAFVALGGVLAVATSVNATMMVPSRLLVSLADDGHVPRVLGSVNERTGTPVIGLTLTLAAAAGLLLAGQVGLALNIAVFALFILYGLHGIAALWMPRRAPRLWAEVPDGVSRRVMVPVVAMSVAAMIALVVLQIWRDLEDMGTGGFRERWGADKITTVELLAAWAAVGAVLWLLMLMRARAATH